MVGNVSVTYPHDGKADWELGLTAFTQLHERISYHIELIWEKNKFQNSKYSFY